MKKELVKCPVCGMLTRSDKVSAYNDLVAKCDDLECRNTQLSAELSSYKRENGQLLGKNDALRRRLYYLEHRSFWNRLWNI